MKIEDSITWVFIEIRHAMSNLATFVLRLI